MATPTKVDFTDCPTAIGHDSNGSIASGRFSVLSE
jgi:hypothetical protein